MLVNLYILPKKKFLKHHHGGLKCRISALSKCLSALVIVSVSLSPVYSQENADSVKGAKKIVRSENEMHYQLGNGTTLIYEKPKNFGFIRNLPRDAGGIASAAFKKESVKPWIVIAASTGILLLTDQAIADGVIQFSENINLHPEEKNKNLLNFKLSGKDVSLFRLPANINTALYQIGQGFPSLLIGAGLYTYGKNK